MSRRQPPAVSEARLEAAGKGAWVLRGRLDLSNVGPMVDEATRTFGTGTDVTVDLSGVERSDSAGLALLVEWAMVVKRRGGSLHLTHVPAQLLAIARLSGLDETLRMAGDE